jgi:hypothetical protein
VGSLPAEAAAVRTACGWFSSSSRGLVLRAGPGGPAGAGAPAGAVAREHIHDLFWN